MLCFYNNHIIFFFYLIVPDFANHITALAVDAIKKEPLFAEYLLRKKQVPMPMLCADEIKTEPAEVFYYQYYYSKINSFINSILLSFINVFKI